MKKLSQTALSNTFDENEWQSVYAVIKKSKSLIQNPLI